MRQSRLLPRTALRRDEPLCILHDQNGAHSPYGELMERRTFGPQQVQLYFAPAYAEWAMELGVLYVYTPTTLAHAWRSGVQFGVERKRLPPFGLDTLAESAFAPMGSVTVRGIPGPLEPRGPAALWTRSVFIAHDTITEDHVLQAAQRVLWAEPALQQYRAAWEYEQHPGLRALIAQMVQELAKGTDRSVARAQADKLWLERGLPMRAAMESSRLIPMSDDARRNGALADAVRDAALTDEDRPTVVFRMVEAFEHEIAAERAARRHAEESDSMVALQRLFYGERYQRDTGWPATGEGPDAWSPAPADATLDGAGRRKNDGYAFNQWDAQQMRRDVTRYGASLERRFPDLSMAAVTEWLDREFPVSASQELPRQP
jgi:hypothetical protein